ncbi:type II toxin-antitoxin system RelE/ParE family toxin [Neorhizobium alkalisoli]|uniref:Plasmid stabilization system protein ParE n=1 Tax=Neorhizobium alkalisoli TaxID=528178 RepID=A0A561R1L1_9HYPH|nr:type II toxin-antitoxin system RelE/ParE family toxin [Neorhizobium alkalisoli]TWF56508.1 plasmid stabilization system protein ParE [Neorhizobium alkalisoli]
MTAKLQWSRDALEDFKRQIGYIAEHNPESARDVAKRVDECALRLSVHSTGRPGRVAGTLEKSVAGLPYILAYNISATDRGSVLTVLRLIHTSRDWRKGQWPKED